MLLDLLDAKVVEDVFEDAIVLRKCIVLAYLVHG